MDAFRRVLVKVLFNSKLVKVLGLLLAILIPLTGFGFEVTHFSPEGLTNSFRQVKVQFSEPMLALSDASSKAKIFKIDCAPGKGGYARWNSDSSWVYSFYGHMTGGTKCQFTLKNSVRALAGSEVVGKSRFEFSLDGPLLSNVYPYNMKKVHALQPFVLVPEVDVDLASLKGNVYFEVQEDKSETTLRVEADIEFGSDMAHEELNDAIFKAVGGYLNDRDRLRALIITPKTPFSEAAKGYLVWGAGIKTQDGKVTKTLSGKYAFSVLGPLELMVSCNRVEAKGQEPGGCNPLNGIVVRFSHPVPTSRAESLRLWDEETGHYIDPEKLGAKDSHVESVRISAPFKENHSYQLFIPSNFADEDGRKPINRDEFAKASGFIKTGAIPPLVRFSGRFGVLESKLEVLQIPLKLRRVEARLTRSDISETGFFALSQILEPTSDTYSALTTSDDGNSIGATEVTATDLSKTVGVQSFQVDASNVAEAIKFFRWVNSQGGQNSESLFERMGLEGQVKRSHIDIPVDEDTGLVDEAVIGLGLKGVGFHLVEVASEKLGEYNQSGVEYVSSSTLVTNLSIHTKISPQTSLVWVTSLDLGEPVAGAQVQILDCSGEVLWSGATDHDGVAFVSTDGKSVDVSAMIQSREACAALGKKEEPEDGEHYSYQDYDPYNRGGYVVAIKGNDFSLSHTSWNEGIEPYRFNVSDYLDDYNNNGFSDQFLAHSILDRSLFKLGETVSMKHIVRSHNGSGPDEVLLKDLPEKVWIVHLGSGDKIELNINDFNPNFGRFTSEWTIPKEAKLGLYQVTLVKSLGDNYPDTYVSGRFRVGDFKLPSMSALIHIRPETTVASTKLDLNLTLSYLNGGPAKHAPVNLRYYYSPEAWPSFKGFEEYDFSFEEIKAGEVLQGSDDGFNRYALAKGVEEAIKTDSSGGYKLTVKNLPQVNFPYGFFAEMEYTDASSENHTKASHIRIWHADRLIGLKLEAGSGRGQKVKVHAAVVTPEGKAVVGEKIRFSVFNETYYTIRTQIKGGAYLNLGFSEVTEVENYETHCSSETTGPRGTVICDLILPKDIGGKVWVQATMKDSQGRPSLSSASARLSGDYGDYSLGQSANRMDIFTNKVLYDPVNLQEDRQAKIQIGTAFKKATALITVEREGILSAKVVAISASAPNVEIPVVKAMVPKAYVSVLAVRGRIGNPKDVGRLDLSRPSFRMGMTEINVDWASYGLNVEVTPNQTETYKPGSKVQLKIKVTRAAGAAGDRAVKSDVTEVTLAVVDEGLLQIAPNKSWNLLRAMMKERPHQVSTSTNLSEVIGARHLGSKSLPSGGGGGQVPNTREIADSLVKWIPNVPIKNGEATLSFDLGSALSKFRVIAIATSEQNLFGQGQVSIATTQDLILINGMSTTARSDDAFAARWTLRNTSNKPLTVTLSGRHTFEFADRKPEIHELAPQNVEISAEDATLVDFGQVDIPKGAIAASYYVLAVGPDGESDSFIAKQKILPQMRALPLMTKIAQVGTEEGQLSDLNIELPEGGDLTKGGVEITLAKSISAGLGEVKASMARYPFLKSLLFKLSEHVIHADNPAAEAFLKAELTKYIGADGFVKSFKGSKLGDPATTAAALNLINELTRQGANTADSALTGLAKTLLAYAKGELRKDEAPWSSDHVDQKLILVLRLSIAAALKPSFPEASLEVVSLLPKEQTEIDLGALDTVALVNWHQILEPLITEEANSKSAFLIGQLRATIETRVNFVTRAGLVEVKNSSSRWSGLNRAAVQAKLISTLLGSPFYQSEKSPWKSAEVLLLVLGLNQDRQVGRGQWRSYLANAYGSAALRGFTRVYENQAVTGTSIIQLGGVNQTVDWATAKPVEKLKFPWEASKLKLNLSHNGTGQPWATVTSIGAVPITEDVIRGLKITKSIKAIRRFDPNQWTRTDIIEVTVKLQPDVDLGAVVLYDPVPAGAKILTESSGWNGYYAESKSGEYKAYVRQVTQNYGATFIYRIQLNSVGTFGVPPSVAEAVAQPETNGLMLNSNFAINPQAESGKHQLVIHDLPDTVPSSDLTKTNVADN